MRTCIYLYQPIPRKPVTGQVSGKKSANKKHFLWNLCTKAVRWANQCPCTNSPATWHSLLPLLATCKTKIVGENSRDHAGMGITEKAHFFCGHMRA
jgi:hypothetical protein